MTPNAMADKARQFLSIYFAAELDIIEYMRGLLFTGTTGNDWAQQKRKQEPQLIGMVVRALRLALDSSLAALLPLFNAAHERSDAEASAEYDLQDAGTQSKPTTMPAPQNRRRSAQETAREQLAKMERIAVADVKRKYRRAIIDATQRAQSGAVQIDDAIQGALNNLADRGIIGHIIKPQGDRPGRRYGIAEYAEMAVRANLMNESIYGYVNQLIKRGIDLVYVSDHADTCPLCEPFERNVLSITGRMRDNPACNGLLMDAVEAGLFHIHCYHYLSIYWPGVTKLPERKERPPSAPTNAYNARARMRRYQRMVRQWKRRQVAANSPQAERVAKAYVDRWQAKIKQLTAETGQRPTRGMSGPRVSLTAEAGKMKPVTFKR